MSDLANLLDESAGAVRPLKILETIAVLDVALEALHLFGIPAVSQCDTGIQLPDDVDDDDADLLLAILRLAELRFPMPGSPRAEDLEAAQALASSESANLSSAAARPQDAVVDPAEPTNPA